ncbi:MAG: FIST C-terminal domain-containing protein [Saprospiraceae bacterium]|nr:FIST C-terminal domain-containing protein [Saprospiraceae bacterium]
MKAKSIRGQTPGEIKQALDKSMQDGFKPSLAIVFMSVKQDRKAISSLFSQHNIAISGATSNGEFIDGDLGKESIAALLLDMNPAHFEILFSEFGQRSPREVSKELAKTAMDHFNEPAFLVTGCHMETDAEQMLYGFADIAGQKVSVYGGMAGDDFQFEDQYVFTNEHETNRGVVVIALDENKIKIKGRATCGWKAVGTEKIVTKSEGNRVFTIDGEPALDITARFGGLTDIAEDNAQLAMEIATNFPLQLQRDKGDPVMRPGLLVNWDDHSYYCSGTVPQGSKVRFSLPPDFDVIEKVISASEELKASEMPEADAVILYSCAGRLLSLGPLMSKEIEGVKEIWNVPLVGMFSNGELGRATGGELEMHNLTTCCVAIKEE